MKNNLIERFNCLRHTWQMKTDYRKSNNASFVNITALHFSVTVHFYHA